MKRPSFQMYPGDWFKDRELRMCSPATRGIWVDIFLTMKDGESDGSITGTVEQLARIPGVTPSEMRAAIDELRNTNVADVTERDEKVTLVNRRTAREFKAAQDHANRQVKYRERKKKTPKPVTGDKKVTFPSSSSSSTSVNPPTSFGASGMTTTSTTDFASPDPSFLAKQLARELHPGHPALCSLPMAEAAFEREIIKGPDPVAFCAAVRKTHAEHCEIWKQALADNPRAYVPQLHVWARDGTYLQNGIPKLGLAVAKKPDRFAHLLEEGRKREAAWLAQKS